MSKIISPKYELMLSIPMNCICFRISLVACLILSCISVSIAQGSLAPTSITKGKIYALIIGISGYKDKDVPKLQYAHRDAQIFADFLSSKAGGSVPSSQIKLLTNEQATVANIYVAKKWLESSAKENDLVFFYFSGHGDVESDLYKLGFLLAYDSPYKNYLNNAVRIEDINNMANTLSIEKNVNTILITDACHSGKLAGSDNRGSALVGEQLSKVEKKEIRIASCEADQLSQEDVAWGGGRGVFSFYLINGLTGLADAGDEDGIITLQEIKTYIESKITIDVANIKQEEQTPIVQGKSLTKMAIVDDEALAALKKSGTGPSSNASSSTSGAKSVDFKPGPMDLYFKALSDHSLKDEIDSAAWKDLSTEAFTDLILNKYALDQDSVISDVFWKRNILNNKNQRYEFKQNMAAAIHSEVQNAINAYLRTDKEELENRQYYNAHNMNYDVYVDMLNKAMDLIDSTNYLYHVMKVKKHYFKGVALRLKMVISTNPDSLATLAMQEQQKALALEGKAAYILNEIGVLNNYFGHTDEAKKYFIKALNFVPTWAIPRSNLSKIYLKSGQYDLGIEEAKKAITFQPDYFFGYINLGRNFEQKGNLLLAEENYRIGTKMNDKHYLPFELLGRLYTNTTQYPIADSFYIEAEIRKQGFFPTGLPDLEADGVIDALDMEPNSPSGGCILDTLMFGPKDAMANFVYAMERFNDYNVAEIYFKRVIAINPDDPIVFRYLGELMWKQKRWMEAEIFFKLAIKNYLDRDSFLKYVNLLATSQKYLDCNIAKRYEEFYFEKAEIAYFLGNIYTQWLHYSKAEEIYRDLIRDDPKNMQPYYLLWNVYEKQGHYQSEESTILSYQRYDADQCLNELVAFYNRMIHEEVDNAYYNYKAGLLMYDEAMKLGKAYKEEVDHILLPQPASVYMPGTKQEYTTAQREFLPASSGVQYLSAASEYLGSEDTVVLAEIYAKLGDLYDILSKPEESKKYYQLSTDLIPVNASVKEKLIIKNIRFFEFANAFKELDYLYTHDQINYDRLLDYARFNIHSGLFDKGQQVLQLAGKSYPFVNKTIEEYKARNFYLAHKEVEARAGYSNMVKLDAEHKMLHYYTLARLYARTSDVAMAFTKLNQAIEAGFNYTWVIDKDETLTSLKAMPQWKEIRAKLPESGIH